MESFRDWLISEGFFGRVWNKLKSQPGHLARWLAGHQAQLNRLLGRRF